MNTRSWVLHGRTEVRLGDTLTEAGSGDVVFVSADEVHQLRTVGDVPLEFLCTALAERAAPSLASSPVNRNGPGKTHGTIRPTDMSECVSAVART